VFVKGEIFTPEELLFETGITTAPELLTETDLITLMEKNKIGTDATIHEHIKTI
jgi:DNA topoisomerase III